MRLHTNNLPTRNPSDNTGTYRVHAYRDDAELVTTWNPPTFTRLLADLAALHGENRRIDFAVGYWRMGERGLTEAEREAVRAMGASQMPVPTGYDADALVAAGRIRE